MSRPTRGPRPFAERFVARLRGDEEALFRAFHRQLVRRVQRRVNTSPDIVEDACAFSWMQFIRSQPDRGRNWQAWLVTTAQREAWRMHREAVREMHMEIPEHELLEIQPAGPRDPVRIRAELRHALDLLAAVPERRRRAKALHVMGFNGS
jgi:DNA-directed RNA polymerase specialized sigma24 family protein